jgi:hypothetical protein
VLVKVLGPAAPQIVQRRHLEVAVVLEQPVDQVTPDEARPSGDDDPACRSKHGDEYPLRRAAKPLLGC